MDSENKRMPPKPIASDFAREYQKKAVESRKRNKAAKEQAKRLEEQREVERNTISECFDILLTSRVSDDKSVRILHDLGIKDENMTNAMLIVAAVFKEALKGNLKAAQMFLNMSKSIELDKLNELLKEFEL